MGQSEADTQAMVADYLTIHYPNVLFHSDFGSGIKLTIGQAKKQKRQNGGRRAWPDMFIAEPVEVDFGQPSWHRYNGLFIELKRKGARLQKKDGTWVTPHIAEQADVLDALEFRGYKAVFAVGFDEAKSIIDDYLKDMVNSVALGQEE